MTRRLYYHDATRRVFTADVVARAQIEATDGVKRPGVRLDQTAFYPTSGGQPHDTGTLAGVAVVDVVEDEEGEVWHLLAAGLPPDLTQVEGRIDWSRRFDHMQQHSGQHLLSAVFEDLGPELVGAAAPTIGFHLGTESSTIDLDLPDLTWAAAFEVEAAVNDFIWQNKPFDVRFLSPDDLAAIALRKPLADHILERGAGDVRIVVVEGVDACACGGTHVAASGAIGIVKITGIAHYKGGIRVEFLCGNRALLAYQRTLQTLQTAALTLSVGLEEVPEALARLQDEAKESRREFRRVLADLLTYEADRLWHDAGSVDGNHVVLSHWSDRDFDEVRTLAALLREKPATVALLAATVSGGGVRVVCARSDDLTGVDAGAILRAAVSGLGGKGGGRQTLAQGGAPYHPEEVVRAALKAAVSEHLF